MCLINHQLRGQSFGHFVGFEGIYGIRGIAAYMLVNVYSFFGSSSVFRGKCVSIIFYRASDAVQDPLWFLMHPGTIGFMAHICRSLDASSEIFRIPSIFVVPSVLFPFDLVRCYYLRSRIAVAFRRGSCKRFHCETVYRSGSITQSGKWGRNRWHSLCTVLNPYSYHLLYALEHLLVWSCLGRVTFVI